jgi:hypothetical protein
VKKSSGGGFCVALDCETSGGCESASWRWNGHRGRRNGLETRLAAAGRGAQDRVLTISSSPPLRSKWPPDPLSTSVPLTASLPPPVPSLSVSRSARHPRKSRTDHAHLPQPPSSPLPSVTTLSPASTRASRRTRGSLTPSPRTLVTRPPPSLGELEGLLLVSPVLEEEEPTGPDR